ncbi:hypothetical protein [Caloramator proteoclasticus]|uniref:Uncharacterized protein n=1 Tax=Caloramator proteoclasticus DSM 10124 TaxID=1121262 RepID=A0A1M4T5G2_9CLOT|nr:hypothetical protein [Caloramator proteoclasticus]SHE39689.1 hypothetical protein SAMN02746091_00320 [Caloramator proteoclasticus DSM 10124]
MLNEGILQFYLNLLFKKDEFLEKIYDLVIDSIKSTLDESEREIHFHTYIELLKEECDINCSIKLIECDIEEEPVVPIMIKDIKEYVVEVFSNQYKSLYISLIECNGKIYIVRILNNYDKRPEIRLIKIDKDITDTWDDEWWGKYIFQSMILGDVLWDIIEVEDGGYIKYKNEESQEQYNRIQKLISLVKNIILDYMFEMKKNNKDKLIEKEVLKKFIINKNGEYIKEVLDERANIFSIITNTEEKITFSYHEISAKYKDAHKKYVAKYAVTIKDDIDALIIKVSIDEENYDYFVVYGFKNKKFNLNRKGSRYTGYIYFEDKSLEKIYNTKNEENGLKIVNISEYNINLLKN